MLATFLNLLGRLPAPFNPATKKILYLLLYRFLGYRRQVVKDNLNQALPESSKAAREDIAQAYYSHLARLALEVVRTPHMQGADFSRHVSLLNPELVESATSNFKCSVVFLGIHQGNWEWMLHAISQHFEITIDPVYKPLHNASADAFMCSVRSQFGGIPIAAKDTGSYVMRNRRRRSAIAVLSDQAPVASDNTIDTIFLGRETRFNNGFAQLARLTKATVIFAQCHTVDNDNYAVQFHAMNKTKGGEESKQNLSERMLTERYVKLAEQAIKAQPHTWLWSHNRWKRSGSD